jgi:hypothetical protein
MEDNIMALNLNILFTYSFKSQHHWILQDQEHHLALVNPDGNYILKKPINFRFKLVTWDRDPIFIEGPGGSMS